MPHSHKISPVPSSHPPPFSTHPVSTSLPFPPLEITLTTATSDPLMAKSNGTCQFFSYLMCFFLAKFGADDHWGLQRLHQADTLKPLGDENTFCLGVPRGEHFISTAELREWVRVPEAGVIAKEQVSE